MKNWKKVATVGSAVLATAVLAACSSGSSTSSSSASNANVTVRVGLFDSGTGFTADQQLAKDYMKAHPNVTIKLEDDPSNYATKLQTELAAGTAPDIFQLGDGDIAGYVSKGVLADVTSYVKGSDGLTLSDYQQNILDIGIVNSKYYVMPRDFSTFAVYINEDMFKAAGLALPSANWTWADFEKDATALTLKSGNTVTQWGANFPATDLRTYLPFMYTYGGNVVSTDGKTVDGIANSAQSVAGWEEYNKLMNVLKVAPGAATEAAANGADLFLSKKAAMNLTGVWPSESYAQAKMNYEVVPIPAGPSGTATGIDFSGYGMYANSKNKSAAWDFMKYLETQGQMDLAQGGTLTSYIPAQTKYKLDTNPVTATFLQQVKNLKMFPERYNQYFAATASADLENVRVQIGAGTGSVDVKSALDAAAKKAQTDLDAADGK